MKQTEVIGYALKSEVVDSVTTQWVPVEGSPFQLTKDAKPLVDVTTDENGFCDFNVLLDPEIDYSVVWE